MVAISSAFSLGGGHQSASRVYFGRRSLAKSLSTEISRRPRVHWGVAAYLSAENNNMTLAFR